MYKVSDYSAGGVKIYIGNTTSDTTRTANGVYSAELVCTGTNIVYLQAIGTTTLSVDYIIVTKVQANGSFVNFPTTIPYVNGPFGKARTGLTFDGTDDYLDFGGDINLGTSNSINFWYKYTTTSTADYFFGAESNDEFGFRYNGSTFLMYIGDISTDDSAYTLTNGLWYNICVVRTSATTVDLYINGELVDTLTNGSWTGDDTLIRYVGRRGNGNYIAGDFSSIKFFTRQLGPEEVRQLFKKSQSRIGGNQ